MTKHYYTYKVVEDYITNYDLWENTEVIEGSLLDNYVIYHANGITEVFEEIYLNEWGSALIRHIYRKHIPKRIQ